MRPGYKQTEVGVIPEDWEAKPLRWAISDLRAGVSVNSETHEGTSSDHPAVLKTSALFEGRVDPRERKPIIARDLERAHLSLRAGSVLISRMNTPELVGECGFIEADKPNLFLPDRIWMTEFDPSAGVSGRWLASVLSSRAMRNRLKGIATGTSGSMKNIAKDAMLSLVLPFPSPSEQRAIAAALGDVDAAVAGLERLIAKKRDLKQAVMQQLLTGQTRLPGFSGAWEMRRLGDHVSFLRNGTLSRAQLTTGDSTRYLHYGDIHGSIDVFLCPDTIDMPTVPAALVTRLDRLQSGDLIFADASEDLDGVGKSIEVQQCDTGLEVVSGLHTIAARFDKDVLADGFKAYLQFMPLFGAHLKKHAAGTKVLATNRAHIASVELPLPTPEEQRAISTVFRDMDAELTALQAQLDKTRLIKQAMMQDLLTGRVRLPFQ